MFWGDHDTTTGDEGGIAQSSPSTMATNTVGQMQEFSPDRETVTAYLEWFQMFVAANSIKDGKLVPTLLTVLGSRHYSLLRGLVSPALPKDKSYQDLVELLTKHYTRSQLS